MKNQDNTEARLAKLKAENERLRSENHNLKRRVKRMEDRKASNKSKVEDSAAERSRRTDEVTEEGIADIKKKLKAEGMPERSMEVMDWFLSEVTGSRKK